MGEMCTEFQRKNLKGRNMKDFGVEGKIIFKVIFKKTFVNLLTVFVWVSTATNTGFCENSNKHPGSMKDRIILTS
jgi:hypothetical protein